MKDNLVYRRQKSCAESHEGHTWIGADPDGIRTCEKCGLVLRPSEGDLILVERKATDGSYEPMPVSDQGEERVNHPSHYGGDTVYETIKVIEAWGLDFHLGNAVKYLSRAGRKGDRLEDLRKAAWYVQRAIEVEQGLR